MPFSESCEQCPAGAGNRVSGEHERFAAKVLCDLSTGCWLWTGAQCGSPNSRHGYFWLDGRGVIASIYAWEQAYGAVPDGLLVLHKRHCSSGLCVRPGHLYVGTHLDNHADRIAGKDTCRNGHPYGDDPPRSVRDGARLCRTCNREQQRRSRAIRRSV